MKTRDRALVRSIAGADSAGPAARQLKWGSLRRKAAAFVCLALGVGCAAAQADLDWEAQLQEAGNAETDEERRQILASVLQQDDLPQVLRTDLTDLFWYVERWALNDYETPPVESHLGENASLAGFFFRKEGLDRYELPRIDEESPLYPLYALYRGRMLIQSIIQSAHNRPFDEWAGEGRRLLEVAREAYPENRIIGMYLDTPIQAWPNRYLALEEAPLWANLQHEGLEKLTDVIHWWIDHRQKRDGSFGGGWGDDVEMWRWWLPVMLGFEDPKIQESQARLSRAVLEAPHMDEGYTEVMADVEHSAEDTADALLPMMHLSPDEEEWSARTRRILELAKERWLGRNERGGLQFKSTYFNAYGVSQEPAQACDTVYHARVFLPALLLWQRTGDEALEALLGDWLMTWAGAAMRDERGKPFGVVPSALHWPDGRVGGLGEHWYSPEIDKQRAVYDWPSVMGYMTNSLLLAYWLTNDDSFLSPIEEMVALRRQHGDEPIASQEPGSAEWCASQMGFLDETLGKYRALFGDTRFDGELGHSDLGYTRFRIGGSRDGLIENLETNARAFRINWPAYTRECRWTDRVVVFWRYYGRATGIDLPKPDYRALYSSVTGDLGYGAAALPLNAVRWKTSSRQIGALVSASDKTSFEAELFHFGDSERPMGAEFFLLDPGVYEIELLDEADRVVWSAKHNLNRRHRAIDFVLPPKELHRLRLDRVSEKPIMYELDDEESHSQQEREAWVDQNGQGLFDSDPRSSRNYVYRRRYIFEESDWSNYHVSSPTFGLIEGMQFDTGEVGYSPWRNQNSGQLFVNDFTTFLAGLQARYFDDHLVLGLGFREDKLVRDLAAIRDENNALFRNEFGEQVLSRDNFSRSEHSGNTKSLGGVYHLNRWLPDQLLSRSGRVPRR